MGKSNKDPTTTMDLENQEKEKFLLTMDFQILYICELWKCA